MSDNSRFYKMSGSGNDFVVFDGREHAEDGWPPDRIRAVCDRRRGVGADGIVLLSPGPDGGVRIRYFNADGSHAALCGNAALCATRLAPALGLASPERVRLNTDAGLLESRCVGPGWAAELLFPAADVPQPLAVELVEGERRAFQGTVGVPHTVVLVDDVHRVDVEGRGRQLRFAPHASPAGTNVNFVSRLVGGDADWAMRTYERGVEAETLACGTGTVAVALALAGAGLSGLPTRIRSSGGSVLSVAGRLEGALAKDVWLCGEGRLVFSGSLSDAVESE
jgi:diaminopimelate epimerase